MALNKVLLIGNVGKDPEVRHLESGTTVATITLATSEKYRDRNGETRELTEWHTVVAWRQLAELAENYIRKGTQIYVEGKIRSRSWDDQNGQKRYATEIQADAIQLLGRRPEGQASAQQPAQGQQRYGHQPAPQASTPIVTPSDLTDEGTDDLPF